MNPPLNCTQQWLNSVAKDDEARAIVLTLQSGGIGTYTLNGRKQTRYKFVYSTKIGRHMLRFPESLWNAEKQAVAKDIFERLGRTRTILPYTEAWDADGVAKRNIENRKPKPAIPTPAEVPAAAPESPPETSTPDPAPSDPEPAETSETADSTAPLPDHSVLESPAPQSPAKPTPSASEAPRPAAKKKAAKKAAKKRGRGKGKR